MADNKGRIRFLRTNGITSTNRGKTLFAGQPFYDMNTKHLYVGEQDGKTIADSTPIVADANNIVFNCTYDNTTTPKKLSCTIPGYKNIENQRAFLISDSVISAGTSNINLYINEEDRGVITIPTNGVIPNSLYRLEYTEETPQSYSWKIISLYGEYDSSKKRLLWNDSVSINSISPVEIVSLSTPLDTNITSFEFVCESANNGNYSIKIPFNNTSVTSSYVINFGFYPNASSPYITYSAIRLSYSNLTNSFYGECFRQDYYISNLDVNVEGITMNVTKIYGIIE